MSEPCDIDPYTGLPRPGCECPACQQRGGTAPGYYKKRRKEVTASKARANLENAREKQAKKQADLDAEKRAETTELLAKLGAATKATIARQAAEDHRARRDLIMKRYLELRRRGIPRAAAIMMANDESEGAA